MQKSHQKRVISTSGRNLQEQPYWLLKEATLKTSLVNGDVWAYKVIDYVFDSGG